MRHIQIAPWIEGAFIDGYDEKRKMSNRDWIIRYLQYTRPLKTVVCGLVNHDTDNWDFGFADTAQVALPETEIRYRPYVDGPDDTGENWQWRRWDAKTFVSRIKSRLQGRPFRVTIGNEPAFTGNLLRDFLAASIRIMEEAHIQGVKLAMFAWQAKGIPWGTTRDNDWTMGVWDDWLRVAGELSEEGTIEVDYDEYTFGLLQAGMGNPFWLEQFMFDPPADHQDGNGEFQFHGSKLRDPKNWVTPEYTWKHPFDNRHLLRYRWANLRAQAIGAKQHKFLIRECGHDLTKEDSLMATILKANGIAGKRFEVDVDHVSGLNTLHKVTEWLFPGRNVYEMWRDQYVHYVRCLKMDPYFLQANIYAYTTKNGDQYNYSLVPNKELLELLSIEDDVYLKDGEVPTTPAPTPVPIEQPGIPLKYVKVTGSNLRVRTEPNVTAAILTVCENGRILTVAAGDEMFARGKIGKAGRWVNVMIDSAIFGWVSAEYVAVYETQPAPAKDWRTELSLTERQRKIVENAQAYMADPFGDVGHNLKEVIAKMARYLDVLDGKS